MAKRILILVVALMMCLGILSSCSDYGYDFYFNVVGENGKISAEYRDGTITDESPVILRGNKKTTYQLKFIATPDEGYQVKEWTCNGEVIEGNKTNTFITESYSYKQRESTITVEFEPIPSKE